MTSVYLKYLNPVGQLACTTYLDIPRYKPHMVYTTDLAETEFKAVEPLFILNGIFYQLVNGCRRADLPPCSAICHWF